MENIGMKENNVRRVLRLAMDKWINSIKNKELQDAVRRDAFITGGSIVSLMMGDPLKDFDVYFRTKETTIAVANYYCKEFYESNKKMLDEKRLDTPRVVLETIRNLRGEEEERVNIRVQSAGVAAEQCAGDGGTPAYEYFEATDNAMGDATDRYLNETFAALKGENRESGDDGKAKYRPVFMSSNAITLSDKFQLVIRFFGEPEDIYANYDFVHVCQAYKYRENKLELNQEALSAMMSKTLIYRGSLYPIASLFRTKKFLERGWRISAGQILKMAFQTSKVDFTNPEVLREQLTGVDAAYFYQVMQKLEARYGGEKLNERGCYDLEDTYLMQLLDHLFEGRDLPMA